MKLPDLAGIERRVEAGQILDAAEIKLLIRIIRRQMDRIDELERPTLFDGDFDSG